MSGTVVICPGNESEAKECVSTTSELKRGKYWSLHKSVDTDGILLILTTSLKFQGLVTLPPHSGSSHLWMDGWMLQLVLPEQALWIPHFQVSQPYLEPFQGKSSPVFDLIVLFTHHTNYVGQREGQQDRQDGLFA